MYGGKVEVPEGCDILVAGFCCDDFSTLNNVQKTLEEKGESGDTFFAVIAYMEMYHPLLVVLENVIGAAPWVPQYDKKTGKRIFKMKNGKEQDKSIQEFCEEAGYYTIFFKVDTKDYYLPQTRLRGYMVCVLKNVIQTTEWKTLKEKCVKMVKDFERPASAPVEAFLFKSDDPALKVLHEEARSDRKPVNWDKCTINHEEYRRDLGLGRNHMLTDWKTDGSSVLPDFHVRMSNGTERVLDSLDIAHGRCLQRGFDDRYFK
jgi:site-specific DNA-cytosine methylase